ncbi:serine hydrolase domain-containing protein [Streptomyces sp. E11-3]|uniref:serine hydrolase domain-containing protein n=1 Tax=Streptomyces sp. E11-3 TaxID=3110112 RepID=UPI00397FE06F
MAGAGLELPRGFSGTLRVVRGETVACQAAAGACEAGTGAPCTPDTRFQIASVSKQFTATAALLLAEEGRLTLDAPIAHWLPGCPAAWQHLTLHQLLSHTAGLGHWQDIPGFHVSRPGHADDVLDQLSKVPLRNVPGREWYYSSPGYLLVARVVERIAGQPYADFVTERILRPLGMRSTCVGAAPSDTLAYGHRNGRRVYAPEFAALPGPGDVWSTVGDLHRFTAARTSSTLLGAGSSMALVTPHARLPREHGTDGPATADSYGYGYCLGTLAGHPAYFHHGDNPGYQSFLARLPDLDVTLAVLCNDEAADIDALLWRLEAVLAGG